MRNEEEIKQMIVTLLGKQKKAYQDYITSQDLNKLKTTLREVSLLLGLIDWILNEQKEGNDER